MAIIGGGAANPFNRRVTGVWGQLRTTAGVVPYVLTSARLSRDGTDDEARLLRDLQPVREVLPNLGDEDFGLLLQRPLDDHRVSGRLVPYLLQGSPGGVPGFFPSVLVAAIPFDQQTHQPHNAYDPAQAPEVLPTDDANFTFGPRERQSFGEMFRVSRLWDMATGTAHESSLAMFEWASERIKLVILDGQHRAMSLLAIQRNLTAWPPGNPYEEFYKKARALVPDTLDIEGIRLPVTLVWFPPPPGGALDPVKVARSMFVTVNNEARRVGEARIMMLNDSELVPQFTRELLERMRAAGSPPSWDVLETVLYEDSSQGGPARAKSRWTTLTDLKTLGEAVTRSVFYGAASEVSESLYRPKWTPNASFAGDVMRRRLQTGNRFPIVNDVNFTPGRLANNVFPDEWVGDLRELFAESWGAALLWLYSAEGPFGAHAKALAAKKAGWPTATAPERLAHEAAFEGTGLWAVLQNHYTAHVVATMGPRPDTNPMQAYALLLGEQDSFEADRAARYLGQEATAQDREWTRAVFEIYKTEACQIGLVGAMTWLALTLRLKGGEIADFGKHMALALSRAFDAERPDGGSRRFALARRNGAEDPYKTLNLIRQPLQKGNAREFRYMWLQLLCAPEAQQQFEDGLPNLANRAGQAVTWAACHSRVEYLNVLRKQRRKELERDGHATPQAQATQEVGLELSSALNVLFDAQFTAASVWECQAPVLEFPEDPEDVGEQVAGVPMPDDDAEGEGATVGLEEEDEDEAEAPEGFD